MIVTKEAGIGLEKIRFILFLIKLINSGNANKLINDCTGHTK